MEKAGKPGKGLALTRHFEKRWWQRVGSVPSASLVNEVIADSVKVQPCEDFRRPDGSRFRVLAIYWHPWMDLVIKVDEFRRNAVTVFSEETWKERMEKNQRQKNLANRSMRIAGMFRPSVPA